MKNYLMKRNDFLKAKEVLDNSGVIAFPTETVMGLGVYFNDFKAYNLLNEVKRRPEDKPYTLMLGNIDDISLLGIFRETVSPSSSGTDLVIYPVISRTLHRLSSDA